MAVTDIKVNGVSVDLNTIAADVTIRIGRQDIYTTYCSNSAVVTFYSVSTDLTRPYVGQTIQIKAGAYTRFYGTITDARLNVPVGTSSATMTVTAVGDNTNVAYNQAGGSGFAQETAFSRIQQLQIAVGAVIIPQWTDDERYAVLAAYSSGAASPRTFLDDICNSVRAIVYTSEGGTLRIQSLAYRNTLTTQTLAPGKVLFSPVWQQNTQVINYVIVNYSAGSVYATDARSVSAYGPRYLTIDTTLVSQADAARLASLVLARSKRPRWQLETVGIIQDATEVAYDVGQPIKITNLPNGSPADTAYGVVEGWEHRYVGDRHTTTYFVSDPVQSGIAVAWEDVPATVNNQWQDVLPIVWDDAITLSDMFA